VLSIAHPRQYSRSINHAAGRQRIRQIDRLLAAPNCSQPSIQFGWVIIFALGPGHGVDACPQARESCVGLRSKVREYLPIGSLDLDKNFIDLRKHSLDEPNHLGDLTPQLLYVPLALFTAIVEIAHAPPNYPASSRNCSNSSRKFSGGPLVPSLMTGETV
jgi:hypothetical protein